MRLELVGGGLILGFALVAGCTVAPAASVARPASVTPSVSLAIGSPTPTMTGLASAGPDGSVGPVASPPPVILTASGTTDATASGEGLAFTATASGSATCGSRPDQLLVGGVTALDLGTLGDGTLRAHWEVPTGGVASTTIEAFIDGADLADGAFQPFWSGPARLTVVLQDGTSGTLAFGPLTIEPDPALKPGETARAGVVEWPAALSGTVRWSCAPWPTPAFSAAPPPSGRP